MMRKAGLVFVLIVVAVCAASGRQKLNEAEQALVDGSKSAIMAAGISEGYFDAHFKLVRVVITSGDRRVVWRFSVNGHEALVNDTVGFYTEGGKRVYIHSVAGTLGPAHDITNTITRRRAERIMRTCLGPFEGGAVTYGPAGAPPRASLVFTATSLPRRKKSRAERVREERARERREREEREKARREGKTVSTQGDTVEEEDEGGDEPLFIGAVDLETGRCTKGLAISGPPPPKRRPR
jgi:hypothetical protein